MQGLEQKLHIYNCMGDVFNELVLQAPVREIRERSRLPMLILFIQQGIFEQGDRDMDIQLLFYTCTGVLAW